jgi:hypothetical protein
MKSRIFWYLREFLSQYLSILCVLVEFSENEVDHLTLSVSHSIFKLLFCPKLTTKKLFRNRQNEVCQLQILQIPKIEVKIHNLVNQLFFFEAVIFTPDDTHFEVTKFIFLYPRKNWFFYPGLTRSILKVISLKVWQIQNKMATGLQYFCVYVDQRRPL